jgi:hypothetical protein
VLVSVLLLAVVVAIALMQARSRTDATPPAGTPARSTQASVPAGELTAVQDLLQRRARAVTTHDSALWMGTVTPAAGPFRSAQQKLFERLVTLAPAAWNYTAGTVSVAGKRLTVPVDLTYRLAADGPTVTRHQALTVTGGSGHWWVSAAEASQPADLWDLGPITRETGTRCLVIGSQQQRVQVRWLASSCGRIASTVETAVPGGGLRTKTVLVVPANLNQLARLLSRSNTAGLDRTAAVTIGPQLAPAEAVLVNGDAFHQLRPLGRRIVLTHEFVHVATRADDTAAVPTWLDEGVADEIAYRGSGLGAMTIAGPVIKAARSGRYPTALPGASDFNAAGSDPGLAYARAWSAADTIAARVGLARLVELHHLVGTGQTLDAAFRSVLGVDTRGFIPLWRRHLRQLVAETAGAAA